MAASERNRKAYGRINRGQQKPLMAVVEITSRCNMSCPVCFADAGRDAVDVELPEIRRRLLKLLEIAGPVPLQISGGEPTLHKDLPEVIACARECGFSHIELITNGILISSEPHLLELLVAKGLSSVYLQFDGLNPRTHKAIRGQDMASVRSKSLAAIKRAGLCCALAMTVVRGINDHEFGDVIKFAVEHIDTVRAINFQAATRFKGRFEIRNGTQGYSVQQLLQTLEEQAGIPADSFLSGLAGHEQCNAMSLVYVIGQKFEPLFKYISPETLQVFLAGDERSKILDLFGGKESFCRRHLFNPSLWKMFWEAAPVFGRHPGLDSILKARHLVLFAKSFMEPDNMLADRTEQCCYSIAAEDGVYSFCAYNNLYRF